MYQMLHQHVSVSFYTLTGIISYANVNVSFYTMPMMYQMLQRLVSEFSTGFSTGCGKVGILVPVSYVLDNLIGCCLRVL